MEKDEREAAEWFRKAAEQGDADAQFSLGAMLVGGRGVEKDEGEAAEWFRKAAEQGHAKAQGRLGVMLAGGQGVEKDEREAAEWYRKAADQGNPEAQCLLGTMLAEGKGVEKDGREAAEWYRKAAEQGQAEAQNLSNKAVERDTNSKACQIVKSLYQKWFPNFDIEPKCQSEHIESMPVENYGTFQLICRGNDGHDDWAPGQMRSNCHDYNDYVKKRNQYISAIENYQHIGMVDNSINLIKANLVASFTLDREIAKETFSYSEHCSNCAGRGNVRCPATTCLNGYVTCPTCSGSRYQLYPYRTLCSTCGGSGRYYCRTCGGSGSVNCGTCKATGWLTYYHNIYTYLKSSRRCEWSDPTKSKWAVTILNSHLKKKCLKQHLILLLIGMQKLLNYGPNHREIFP